jgi:hypothetical protein
MATVVAAVDGAADGVGGSGLGVSGGFVDVPVGCGTSWEGGVCLKADLLLFLLAIAALLSLRSHIETPGPAEHETSRARCWPAVLESTPARA